MPHRTSIGSHPTATTRRSPVEAGSREQNLSHPTDTTKPEADGSKTKPTQQPHSVEVPKISPELPIHGPQNRPADWPHDEPQADDNDSSGAQLRIHPPSRPLVQSEGHPDNHAGNNPLAHPEEHPEDDMEGEPEHMVVSEQNYGSLPQSTHSSFSSDDISGYLSDLGRGFADGLVSTGVGIASDITNDWTAQPQKGTPNYSDVQDIPALDGPQDQDGEEGGEDTTEQDDEMDLVDEGDGISTGRYDEHESTEYHPEHNKRQGHSDSHHAGGSDPSDLYYQTVDAYPGEQSDYTPRYGGDGFDEQSGYGYDNHYYGDEHADAW